MKEFVVLAEHQEEALKEGNLQVYQGLRQQEAALLKREADKATNPNEKETLRVASNEAMIRALAISKYLSEHKPNRTTYE